jgi:hypothetical protein
MGDGRGPVAVALCFFLAACIASFAIGTPAGSVRGPAAADAFLATWRQSRSATFVVDSAFTRTLPDGNRLEQTVHVVQRPPGDRLTIGFGSIEGRLGGKIVRCASAPDGTSRCVTGADAVAYDSEVDAEVSGLERYLRGDRPLYTVIEFSDAPGRCFRLDLALALPSPPYGNHALFCFDEATLAPSLTVIERDEATDRTQATAIRTVIAASELDLNRAAGSVVGAPGPTTSTTTTVATGG